MISYDFLLREMYRVCVSEGNMDEAIQDIEEEYPHYTNEEHMRAVLEQSSIQFMWHYDKSGPTLTVIVTVEDLQITTIVAEPKDFIPLMTFLEGVADVNTLDAGINWED